MIYESRYDMIKAEKVSGLSTTAKKGAVANFGDVIKTPEGKDILGTENKLIRTRMRLIVSGSSDIALASSATVSIEVYTGADGTETLTSKVATFGPYAAADLKGKILSFELPNDKILGAVQIGLVASAAQTEGGAGSISAYLLSKLD